MLDLGPRCRLGDRAALALLAADPAGPRNARTLYTTYTPMSAWASDWGSSRSPWTTCAPAAASAVAFRRFRVAG